MSFYVVIPSNCSKDTRPSNTPNDFIVDYENPIELKTGNWTVGLIEFSFTYNPQSIKKGTEFEYVSEWIVMEKIEIDIEMENLEKLNSNTLSNFKHTHGSVIQNGYVLFIGETDFQIVFGSLEDAKMYGFESIVNRSNTSSLPTGVVTNKKHYVVGSKITVKPANKIKIHQIFMKHQNTKNSFKFKSNVSFTTSDDLCTYFLVNCSHIFKTFTVDRFDYISFSLQTGVNSISFDFNLAIILGFDTLLFKHGDGIIKANRKLSLHSVFNKMYIYSSIVEPVYVGHVRVPLLRTIWMENKYMPGEQVHIKLDHPIYLPVASKSFNKIEVNIRDEFGNFIKFSHGSTSSLTLHFRQM